MIIKSLNALGVYGNASLNSVDLALIATDGIDVQHYIKTQTVEYPEDLCANIRTILAHRSWSYTQLKTNPQVQLMREKISCFYAECIQNFASGEKVDCYGIDGLTIFSNPAEKCSYQLEDGRVLADSLKQNIITHFHRADLLSGGQASPLCAAFINYLGQRTEKPALFIIIDATGSLTYLGHSGEIQAFDCAPGTAMIEDWTFRHANMLTDYNGKLGIIGKADMQIVSQLLRHKILHKQPPKALDVMCFSEKKEHLEGLSLENGTATATAFIAEAVYQAALDFLPKIPTNIFIGGEGCKNPTLLRFIKQNFAPRAVLPITEIEPELTAFGAQSTAFNTVRRLYGLPLTYPTTTGAFEPMSGGEIYEKSQ
ncbi:MAG: anhydro-N-acetylmuramic acid kinase [Alphaproteobacteria bacterium]|nr:anhydro-N-acetylmuramic acid kinase [Alphaproteobacteria bacterium]